MVIRGYGDQTNFNGNGYKAYYNDISLTDADGTTRLMKLTILTSATLKYSKGRLQAFTAQTLRAFSA